MSILDDAIREHLELKRAHGADEAELKKLEDEAFGPPQRPEEDAFGEAPTEFLGVPEEGRAEPSIADLQEPPPPPAEIGEEPADSDAPEPEGEAPPTEQEAMEHRAIPEADESSEPVADPGPSTEEREAIAEQPTQFFDIESEMDADEEAAPPEAESPGPPESQPPAPPEPQDAAPPEAEVPAPPAPAPEPPPAPEPQPQPPAPPEPPPPEPEPALEDEEDEEFWGEQRLSEELDKALDAPLTEQPEEGEQAEEGEQSEEGEGGGSEGTEEGVYDPDTGQEDVLEATPEFLEDAPEDDELWFEQRPPKDFDFDD